MPLPLPYTVPLYLRWKGLNEYLETLVVGEGGSGAEWGAITGTLSDQTDLNAALALKADSTHTHSTADIASGTLADARVAQSNVTQHQAALAITESQITDFGSYALASHTHSTYAPLVHTHAAADITSGTLADARVAQTNVTQHQAALSITESQVSDLGSYADASHTHAAADITSGTLADARVAQTNVTQHEAALSITESQISDFGTYAAAPKVFVIVGDGTAFTLTTTIANINMGTVTALEGAISNAGGALTLTGAAGKKFLIWVVADVEVTSGTQRCSVLFRFDSSLDSGAWNLGYTYEDYLRNTALDGKGTSTASLYLDATTAATSVRVRFRAEKGLTTSNTMVVNQYRIHMLEIV